MRILSTHVLATSLIAVLAAAGQAADYHVAFVGEAAKVTIKLEQGKTATTFQMPAWLPGDYELFHYGRTVQQAEFRRGGSMVEAVKENANAWIVDGGADEVTYIVPPTTGNFSPNLAFHTDGVFVCGGVFGYFVGTQNDQTTLRFDMPTGTQIGSSPVWKDGTAHFRDYYALIDEPFTLSRVPEASRRTEKAGTVAVRGLGFTQKELETYLDVCVASLEQANTMFGAKPTEHYTFHFFYRGEGGGLEHANGTYINLWSKNPRDAAGIVFHELFHMYNVKLIRPTALVKPDLTKAIPSATLWWLEGVTDYYADVLQFRGGLMDQAAFDRKARQSLNYLRAARATPIVSSSRVWESRGSSGYQSSYYTSGWAVGMVLDLSIRQHSNGKASLDDVMRDLYDHGKDGKGYPDELIRTLCIKHGGEELASIYDHLVTESPTRLGDLLTTAGFTLDRTSLTRQPGSTTATNFPSALKKTE